MPIIRHIAAVAAAVAWAAGSPGGAVAASPRALAEDAGDDAPGADSFAGEADGALEEGRLADLLPAGRLEARWRARRRSAAALRLYQRVDWQPRPGLAAHFLAERDPGEARWDDFSSGYVDWRGQWGSATAGDLRPGFGQGLVFGRSGARGGVSSPAPVGDRSHAGYRSTGESGAVRGLLLSLRQGSASAAVLWSRFAWDGRVSEEGTLTSALDAGTHVTASERAARDQMRGSAVGVAARWQGPGRAAGLQVLAVDLTRELDLRRPGKVARAFRGRGQRLVSADFRWTTGAALAYGEGAVDSAGRGAAVGGLRLGTRAWRAAALAYYYPPEWHSFLGGAVSSSGMSNERGLHAEVAGRGWRAYVSEHRRLQAAYTHPLPAPTSTWGAQAERRLGRGWRVAAATQVRAGAAYSRGVERRETSRRARVDLQRQTGGQRWRLRCEGRAVRSGGVGELGALASLAWRWRGRRGELALHGSGFRTPSYASRLYEYETDLPGAVSILPLYGSGWRAYAVARLKWRGWTVGLRYRQGAARGRPTRREGALQLDLLAGS